MKQTGVGFEKIIFSPAVRSKSSKNSLDASSLLQSQSIRKAGIRYRALLVGQYGSSAFQNRYAREESLKELILLADTAGIKNSYEIFLNIPIFNPRFFFTKGHLHTITKKIREKFLNLLIIDAELSPKQIRNLEEELKVRVIGRVELILDIFAMRAKTKISTLQVELAQLTYVLPRLKGLGGVLSRLGGGIGTKGPGETMLEKDRRHIRRRIQRIKRDIEHFKRHRKNMRKNRKIPTFALVGYTNAGKTTLLNQLSSSPKKLFAEDRLFATLDLFSRQVYLGQNKYKPFYCIMTDTVGFIRNLPATLVAAFQSTLEEIYYTDAIIIVVDVSQFSFEEELSIIEQELKRIGVQNKPTIIFFNKVDIAFPKEIKKLRLEFKNAVFGNSLTQEGVKPLKEKLFLMCNSFVRLASAS